MVSLKCEPHANNDLITLIKNFSFLFSISSTYKIILQCFQFTSHSILANLKFPLSMNIDEGNHSFLRYFIEVFSHRH